MRGLLVTNPARTAFDLARHLPRAVAVAHLDALSAATGVTAADVTPLIERHRDARGVRQCRNALSLMDSGAQSPKETWVRARTDRCRPTQAKDADPSQRRAPCGVPGYGMGNADGGTRV
jgi:hypothetical protein